MNKKLLLVFAALFSCSAAFAQTDEQWTVYDLQTNEQQTIDLTEEPLMMPTTIIGDDDRQDITNKAHGFEKAAVVLEARSSSDEKGFFACSGAMIGKNIVLTGAHCLINNNKPFSEVIVRATGLAGGGDDVPPPSNKKTPKTPGVNNNRNKGSTLPYTKLLNAIKRRINTTGDTVETASANSSTSNDSFSAKAVRVWVPSQWNSKKGDKDVIGTSPYDYGLIILDSNLGEQTGLLNVAAKSTKELNQKEIIVLGRAYDKAPKTLWRSEGKVLNIKNNVLYHDADTLGGNSGGPVVLKEHPNTIIALNTFEMKGLNKNGGPFITNVILKAIQHNGK